MTDQFLAAAPESAAASGLYDNDRHQMGFVMNCSRLWAHGPALHEGLFDLLREAARAAGLTKRQQGVLVTTVASTLGDSYCALAWGAKLADAADPVVAATVLDGRLADLAPDEQALARWAASMVEDPCATTAADLAPLRDAGFDDEQIFALTVFASLRLAFSTVNDALGARPDAELREVAPPEVLEAVTYGRPIEDGSPAGG